MILMFNFSPLGSLRDFSPLLPVLSQPLLITPEEPEEAASFSEKGLLPARQSLSGESPAHQNPAERGNSVSPATELHREAFRLMQQICDIYPDHSEPLRIPMIYSCLIQFFVLVGRHHVRRDLLSPDTKSRRQTDCYERLNASLNFINSNYMNDISVEDAARTAGFSKFHFSRLFKQFTEQTFCEYLNQRRINAAETLLLNQRLSVTDVALQGQRKNSLLPMQNAECYSATQRRTDLQDLLMKLTCLALNLSDRKSSFYKADFHLALPFLRKGQVFLITKNHKKAPQMFLADSLQKNNRVLITRSAKG